MLYLMMFWILLMSIDTEDLKKLVEKAHRMKVDMLFEEPCPIYEADEKDWEDFWYGSDED